MMRRDTYRLGGVLLAVVGLGACRDEPERRVGEPDEPAPGLCEAAAAGDPEMVERLLADREQRDCRHDASEMLLGGQAFSALMAASFYGHEEVARVLVEAGFDPLRRDSSGRSAFVLAAMGNHIDLVDWYWEQGVRLPPDDEYIGTIMWVAGNWNRRPMLQYYLERDAPIDAEHFGYTALVAAAQSGHRELVRWLVERGASTRSPSGRSALEKAQAHGRESVVEYLRSLDVDARP